MSDLDRILKQREAEEAERQAAAVTTDEQRAFLTNALLPLSHQIAEAVADGVRRSMGEVEQIGPPMQVITGGASCNVKGGGPGGAQVTAYVNLSGKGPEFEDATKARYDLSVGLSVRPQMGVPWNKELIDIRTTPDLFGSGRPGVTADAVQRAIASELQRRLR